MENSRLCLSYLQLIRPPSRVASNACIRGDNWAPTLQDSVGERRASPASTEPFRLVSFRIYFLVGISSFFPFKFLHITFSLPLLSEATGERFKV